MAVILNPGRANVFRYGDNATVWADYNDDGRIIRVGLGEGLGSRRADYRKAGHTMWVAPKMNNSGLRLGVTQSVMNKRKVQRWTVNKV